MYGHSKSIWSHMVRYGNISWVPKDTVGQIRRGKWVAAAATMKKSFLSTNRADQSIGGRAPLSATCGLIRDWSRQIDWHGLTRRTRSCAATGLRCIRSGQLHKNCIGQSNPKDSSMLWTIGIYFYQFLSLSVDECDCVCSATCTCLRNPGDINFGLRLAARFCFHYATKESLGGLSQCVLGAEDPLSKVWISCWEERSHWSDWVHAEFYRVCQESQDMTICYSVYIR